MKHTHRRIDKMIKSEKFYLKNMSMAQCMQQIKHTKFYGSWYNNKFQLKKKKNCSTFYIITMLISSSNFVDSNTTYICTAPSGNLGCSLVLLSSSFHGGSAFLQRCHTQSSSFSEGNKKGSK